MLVLFENQFDELADRLKNVTMELVDDVIDILFVGNASHCSLDTAIAAYVDVVGEILRLEEKDKEWLSGEATIRVKLCKELGEHYVEKRGMVVGVFMEFVYLILLERFVRVRDDSMIEDWKAMMQNMEDDGR